MKVDKKANFCIFFVIAILALGLSNFAAAFTGDFVNASFPGINDTDKMIALDDDNFAPISVNAVYEKKVVEDVNETDNETDTNSTIDEGTSDDNATANTDIDSNTNDHSNSDSNSNSNKPNNNGGSDSSDSSSDNDNSEDSDGE